MTDQKIQQIIESMQGVTYREWMMLKRVIDNRFDSKAQDFQNKLEVPGFDEIIKFYEWEFGKFTPQQSE